jgi:hypothetical protein
MGDRENVAKKAVEEDKISGSFLFKSEKALLRAMATFFDALIIQKPSLKK